MTQEQKRIAIAEACGWKSPNHPDSLSRREGWWSQHRNVWWIDPQGKDQMISSVPDYFNDLNSMHELEKTLRPRQREEYNENLEALVGPQDGWQSLYMWHATAAQRAEALGKTLNLW